MTRPLLARAVDTVMDRSLVLGYTTIGLAVRRALPGWPADPQPRSLEGRHVLVTGASSGLGIATVRELAETPDEPLVAEFGPNTGPHIGRLGRGVSTNVVDASWQALVDAYEYHLIHVEEAKG